MKLEDSIFLLATALSLPLETDSLSDASSCQPRICLCAFPRPKVTSSNRRVQFSSVVQSFSRVQLCNPTDCSTPGFPVCHQLPELAQTHILRVGDAIQPCHPLSSPSPPAFNLSLEGRQNENHNRRGTPAKLAFPAFLCQRRLSFTKSPSWRKTLRHCLLLLGAGSAECGAQKRQAET